MRVYLFHILEVKKLASGMFIQQLKIVIRVLSSWLENGHNTPYYPAYSRQKTEQQLLLEGSVYSDLSICISNLICNKISPPKDFF